MKYKDFYKTFLKLYIVLVLQNVVTLSVNLADNIMLGAYSESALSGVAIANQIQFVYQQVMMALGDGLVILCSQYWGKKDLEPMKKINSLVMWTGVVISLILFLVISLFPIQILTCFTSDMTIVKEGLQYVRVIRFTYFFFAITQILLATLRSVEVVKIAFWLSICTFFINCGINYTLIYGRWGLPELGVTGAAIGTLVARIVECIIIVFYASRQSPLHISFKHYTFFDFELCKDYFKITLPMLAVSILWGLNTALQTVILGHMTQEAIAANSVSSTLFLMVKSTAVGASSATGIIIGKSIGIGDLKLTKEYAKRLQKIFLVIGICSGIFLYLIRIPILNIYNLMPVTKNLANSFLIVLSVVCVGMSYQMPTNTGIIRGGGDAGFVVKMDLISIWIIVIPLSLFMAFVVKASPLVVVCCLNADQIFKCVPAFIQSNYGNWIRKLTR